jgi:hypothetical protein
MYLLLNKPVGMGGSAEIELGDELDIGDGFVRIG